METRGHVPSGQGKVQIMCYCGIGSKISGFVKRGKFLDQFKTSCFPSRNKDNGIMRVLD